MSKYFYKYIYLVFVLLLIKPAFSQQYNIRTYSVEKGLSKSEIYSIIQDSRGYLWLGTGGGGASRFDGKNFVTFNKRKGLIGNVVRTLHEDKKGNIWFGTDDGISIYDGKTFHKIDKSKGLPAYPILKIFEDSDNTIWVGTAGGGLSRIMYFKDDSVNIKTYTKDQDRIQTNYVFDIFEDSSKRLWLALYGGINILSFKGDEISSLKKLDQAYGDIPSNFILTIEKDTKGNLWFGSQDAGAFKINILGKDSGKVVSYSTNNGMNDVTVWDILCDSQGTLWFATDKGGINKFAENSFTHITTKNGLAGNQVYKLFEDNEKNIWMGTFGSGLCQFLGENFIHYNETDGLPAKDILSVVQDKNGHFWIGTQGGGLVQMSFNKGKPIFRKYTTQHGLVDNFVNYLCLGNDGALWIATEKGVSKKVGNIFINYDELSVPMLSNPAKSIFVDSKAIVWIGTSDGMLRYDGKVFFPIYQDDDQYGLFNYTLTILEDKKGEIWYGTYGGLRRNNHLQFIYYDDAEGLLNKQINCIAEDRYGNIWIGTFGSGLFKFDINHKGKTPITPVLNDSLLSSNNISSLIFENENLLIVATDKGFDKVYLGAEQQVINVINFNESDGFTSIENHSNAICKDNQNRIWFGTIKGLTCYNPSLDKTNLAEPKIHLTNINLFFENTEWKKRVDSVSSWFSLPFKLILGHADNHFTFKFAGISYYNPDKVQYKYMLEGLDNTWSPARRDGEAVYPGLPHGEYKFKVISVNKFGKWNEEPIIFSFVIKPPFWKTTWFYIACVVFVFLGFFLFVRLRLQKLRRDKRILEEKVRVRTREIAEKNVVLEVQKKEILEKNEELHQQNEEIIAQRNEIENQKLIVEDKNKEITDSIRYARRIQTAVLPNIELIQNAVQDFFILFKPKDIVSGDFYWMMRKNNFIFVTAADCTGHGVPGAFMSMLGLSFLNDIVNRPEIISTSRVLDELRDCIITSLQQKGVPGEQKDGMDISFCALDLDTNIVEFSGANNPLYIITTHPDTEGEEAAIEHAGARLIELKPDKMPIAIYENMSHFSSRKFQLKKGDAFYMLSDGYADQFGGPKGKKFMSKRFKQMLVEIYEKPMQEQQEFMDKIIEDWKFGDGNCFEQTDDITVVGIKI
ncbi:MAG: hypothetical protein A2309_05375 [Bacteroidetes bacterium RIFOXYB2_FULL_35_7]|nr:MAG: hypothetical protein A2309_05375 [Bacteroidetes bacterium RIFOXYB2_FULL_35_7]